VKQPSLSDLLSVAVEAARLGGKHTLSYFNTAVRVETKPDQTPVTRADREAEEIIRKRILRSFPDHSLMGEEHGQIKGSAPYRWLIDPIDGTKTFIRGVPLYGVLVAVEVKRKVSVGVAYLPALNEMVTAADGLGCQWNDKPARVSKVTKLEDATLLTSDTTSAIQRSDAYNRLASRTRLQRTWGDCYGYVLVATGRAEIMLDPRINPWDCAPFLPILKEAGGHLANWRGQSTVWGKAAFATNAALYREVVTVLRNEKKGPLTPRKSARK